MGDLWAEKYQREVYERVGFHNGPGCRPATGIGIMQCGRPVVRDGRCILHAPKLTNQEKLALTGPEVREEAEFEAQFKTTLLDVAKSPVLPGSIDLQAIQFPQIQWNLVGGHVLRLELGIRFAGE